MLSSFVNRLTLRGKVQEKEFNIEDNYRLPIDPQEGVVQLLIDELKRRIDKQRLFIVRVSRSSNVVYLHTIMYAQKVEFNRVSEHFQHPSIIRILCVLRDLTKEGDFTTSYYDANKNIIEEHRFTTLPAFLSHIDTLDARILDSEQMHYRNLKPYPMGTLSQQHSLVSLLHFQQDFKSELISKRGFNGEVLRDCQLIYETPETKKVVHDRGAQTNSQRQGTPQVAQRQGTQQARPSTQQQARPTNHQQQRQQTPTPQQQPTVRRSAPQPQRRQT